MADLVAVAIVETDEVSSPLAVPRERVDEHTAVMVPDGLNVVIFCPFGMGEHIERGLRQWDALSVLQEMEPRGLVS